MQDQTDSNYEQVLKKLIEESRYDLSLPAIQSSGLSSDIAVVSRYALIPPRCRTEVAAQDKLFWSRFALDPRYSTSMPIMSITEASVIADKVVSSAYKTIEKNAQNLDMSKVNETMQLLREQILTEFAKRYLLV